MNPRRLLFWAHLLAGCAVGLIILLLAVTGILLAFERQIVAWAERDFRVSPLAASESGAAPLQQVVTAAAGGREISEAPTVIVSSDPAAPVTVRFGRERLVLVHPYSAEALGEGASGTRQFFKTVLGLHRWLALEGEARETGKAITGAGCLAFLFLIVSGLVLWVPRQWSRKALRAVGVPRFNLKGKARDWNWHNAFGLWSAPVLIVITITGLVMAYPWANHLLYRLAGDQPPPPRQEGGRKAGGSAFAVEQGPEIDRLLASVQAANPGWQSISVRMPAAGAASVTFSVDRGNGARPDLRSQVAMDVASGAVVSQELPSDRSRGQQWRAWARWLHTGEALGWPGQIAAALGSLAAVLLIWTGWSLAWRRLVVRRPARSEGMIAAAVPETTEVTPS